MRRVINGKVYDTALAELIAEDSYGRYGDISYCCEGVYRTKKGNYFFHGTGGAYTKYAKPTGNGNDISGSSKLEPMTEDEAYTWLEQHECTEAIEKYFPGRIEEA